jgi:hypothetical protein
MVLGDKPHLGHEKHLCYIATSGLTTINEYKPLVKNAKFLCKHCGRVAAKMENLCDPVPL